MKLLPIRSASPNGRNEGRPFQGIDTTDMSPGVDTLNAVEMRVAPFRALTHG